MKTTLRDIIQQMIFHEQDEILILDLSNHPLGRLSKEYVEGHIEDESSLWQPLEIFVDKWVQEAQPFFGDAFNQKYATQEQCLTLDTNGHFQIQDPKDLRDQWELNNDESENILPFAIKILPLPISFLTLDGEIKESNDSFNQWSPLDFPVDWNRFVQKLLYAYHPHTGAFDTDIPINQQWYHVSVCFYRPLKGEPRFICTFYPLVEIQKEIVDYVEDNAAEQLSNHQEQSHLSLSESQENQSVSERETEPIAAPESIIYQPNEVEQLIRQGNFDLEAHLIEQEKAIIRAALTSVEGDTGLAARLLMLSKATLQYKITQLGLQHLKME